MGTKTFCRFLGPVLVVMVSGCDLPASAYVGETCGPLDDRRASVDFFSNGGRIEFQTESFLDDFDGTYEFGSETTSNGSFVQFCETSEPYDCEAASRGSLTIHRQGRLWRGNLEAEFPNKESVSKHFYFRTNGVKEIAVCG